MTVVIGLCLQQHIVLASDGYALHQEEEGAPVIKTDAYSKLRILAEGRFVVGSAGSHEVAIEVCDVVGPDTSEGQSEEAFLRQFGDQVRQVNTNPDGRKAAFLLGYFASGEPRLVLFPADGEPETQNSVAALGSGADAALDYLSSRYDPAWELPDAVGEMVETIYTASQVPTVNFVPMVIVLGSDGACDLSPLAISLLNEFRRGLKQELMHRAVRIA